MTRPPRWIVATLALGLLAFGVAGAWFYLAQRQYLQRVASANLLTISQAKLDQIVAWRNERLGDAAVLQENPFFVRAVTRWLAGRQPELAADILTRLRSSEDHYGYEDVRLVDRAGRVVLATSGRLGALDAAEAADVRAALRDRRPTMGDVYFSPGDSIPHLAVVAPLFTLGGRTSEPLGAVVHVVDARRSLFRLVESWPSPSASAEARLVRRDGDSVLFLTPPRFQSGRAAIRRLALSGRDVPAVMAVLGAEGVVRGVDYRGDRVIATLRAVPGTPWFLVAKVDEAEALAVWRTRVALVFAALLGLALVAGVAAVAVGQRSAKAHYRRLYEAEAALSASETRFRTLVEEAGADFALLDAEGRYVDVTTACCQQLGYTREELLSLSISDIDSLFSPQQFAADFQSLVGKPPLTYLSTHRRKDGTTFPVEVTLSVVRIGGVPQALALARDVSDRMRAVETLRASEERFRHLFESMQQGVVYHAADGQIVSANPAAERILGITLDQMTGRVPTDPRWRRLREDGSDFPGEEHPAMLALRSGRPVLGTMMGVFHPGENQHRWILVDAVPEYRAGDATPFRVHTTFSDITDRKRAEMALRESEERVTKAFRSIPEALAISRLEDGTIVEVNESWHGVFGYSRDEVIGKSSLALNLFGGHSADRERVLALIREQGSVRDLELQIRQKSGALRTAILSVERLEIQGGQYLLSVVQDITERRRAEEALRESETRFRSLFASMTEGFAYCRMLFENGEPVDFIYLDVNAAFETQTGLRDVAGRRVSEVIPGIREADPELFARYARVATTGTPERFEIFVSALGDWLDLSVYSPAPEHFVAVFDVITERKRAEEALRLDHEIITNINDGVCLTRVRDGVILFANRQFEKMFGYDPGELVGKHVSVVNAPTEKNARETAKAIIDELHAHGIWRGQVLNVKKDGTTFWSDASVTSLKIERADYGAVWVAVHRDITERRRGEEALRNREEMLQKIFDLLPVGLWFADKDGTLLRGNPAGVKIWGAEPRVPLSESGVFKARRLPSREEVAPDDWALAHTIREKVTIVDELLEIDAFDGTKKTILNYTAPVLDAQGEVQGAIVVNQDITERKRDEAALRALAGHLNSVREEEHTRIARQIHDELGQALTALRLDLTWVGRKLPEGNPALRRRVDAAVALTDETITVGQRIVAELRPPILDDLGLVPAVEWYAGQLAKRSGLGIELDAGAKELVVPDRLAVTAYRIVQEALTNVARHAQATHVTVRVREHDGALTIEIRDDGQGFPEKAARDPHSFGIVGMRERAASHGGALLITSSPGAGTTVRVTFPPERRKEPRAPR